MGSTGDLGAHQSILRVENVRVDRLQGVPPQIVITVTCGSQQAGLADLILLHGMKNLQLVVFGNIVYLLKAFLQLLNNCISVFIYFRRNAHDFI